MKKNRMMRIASVLLVAVLMSTCAISGTFAKYTTTASGSDEARVAKWGIGSDLTNAPTFSAKYGTASSEEISNGSGDGKNLVAPGAKDSGIYKITGTPEVAYQITFDMTEVKDVFLKGDLDYKYTFGDTTIQYDDLQNNYYPIKWTVSLATSNGDVSGTDSLTIGENKFDTLKEAATAINNTIITFAANENCDVVLTISWEWAFENNYQVNPQITHIIDEADTILGNLATDATKVTKLENANYITLTEDTDYSTTVAYDLTITATQIAPQYS